MLYSIRCALAVATFCFAHVPAAQAHSELPATASATVRYGDLDLGTRAGVVALYERLQAAARVVCRNRAGGELYQVFQWQDCYLEALSAAVGRFELDALDALHRQSDGRRYATKQDGASF